AAIRRARKPETAAPSGRPAQPGAFGGDAACGNAIRAHRRTLARGGRAHVESAPYESAAHDMSDCRVARPPARAAATRAGERCRGGRVHPTDPVQTNHPDSNCGPHPTAPTPPITLLQVASMTSGLAREPEAPADHSVGPVSEWEQKVLAALPHTTYAHEPGTKYLYSNIGFASLGIALSRAAHEPYTTYIEQHILKPLGMTHTAFEPTPAIRDHIARGYSVRRGDAPEWTTANKELDGRGYRVPNGALFSTVDDLARWISLELGEGPAG